MDPNFLQKLSNQAAGAAKMARDAATQSNGILGLVQQLRQESQQRLEEMRQLQGLVEGLKARSGQGTPDVLAVEDIPGRRIPYDLTVQIPIPANQTSEITQTFQLNMDGPFVAVSRYATFISTYTFQVTLVDSTPRFVGRSWGRQRPISSMIDIMDAQRGWNDSSWSLSGSCEGEASAPPTALPSIPTSRSPFRTMEFDGWISVKNSIYPRQNAHVPSSLWAPGFTQTMQLPVLDFYAPGETIEFSAEPSHVNNPAAGNIQALIGNMPYLASQYDGHEGIDPGGGVGWDCKGPSDIITRNPAGVLIVGLLGFKILNPPGARVR